MDGYSNQLIFSFESFFLIFASRYLVYFLFLACLLTEFLSLWQIAGKLASLSAMKMFGWGSEMMRERLKNVG